MDRMEMSDLIYNMNRVNFLSMLFVNPGWIE